MGAAKGCKKYAANARDASDYLTPGIGSAPVEAESSEPQMQDKQRNTDLFPILTAAWIPPSAPPVPIC